MEHLKCLSIQVFHWNKSWIGCQSNKSFHLNLPHRNLQMLMLHNKWLDTRPLKIFCSLFYFVCTDTLLYADISWSLTFVTWIVFSATLVYNKLLQNARTVHLNVKAQSEGMTNIWDICVTCWKWERQTKVLYFWSESHHESLNDRETKFGKKKTSSFLMMTTGFIIDSQFV